MEIITPSKDRVEPVCPVARQCGGCQIQQMSYSAQLKYKQKLVRDNLARIGGITDCEVLPVIGMRIRLITATKHSIRSEEIRTEKS